MLLQYFTYSLNCKSKIHPCFVSSRIYLYKLKQTDKVEFTFANIRTY